MNVEENGLVQTNLYAGGMVCGVSSGGYIRCHSGADNLLDVL